MDPAMPASCLQPVLTALGIAAGVAVSTTGVGYFLGRRHERSDAERRQTREQLDRIEQDGRRPSQTRFGEITGAVDGTQQDLPALVRDEVERQMTDRVRKEGSS